MTVQRQWIGRKGEEMAATHLLEQGYQILERNWASRIGELDIIALKGNLLVICEVRTTTQTHFGYGSQSVNWKKQQKLRRLAMQYAQHKRLTHLNIRIDAVSILLNRQAELQEIQHVEGI